MNDCLICYESRPGLVFLKCSHSMCSICLSKLQKQTCPFCRKKINVIEDKHVLIDVVEVEQVEEEVEPLPEVIRVRFRRRRNRTRTTTETIDVDNRTIIIESVHMRGERRKKPKAGKNNSKKGRWAGMRYHTGNR
jgi:hypothetical protein